MMNSTAGQADPPFTDRVAQIVCEIMQWLFDHSTQIALAVLLGAVIVALLLGAKWVGKRICAADAGRSDWRTIIGRALAKTRLWFMLAIAAHIVASYAHAPADLARTIYFLFVVASTLQAAVFARELIIGAIEHRARGRDEHAALSSAMGIIRLLVTFALFAVALILILSNLGVNVTGLIAGLGVGGIAIGLAAQGIFADLFAALAILFDRPFRKGDAVRYDTTSGTVEEIGLKSTRIRSITGEQVIIANKQLLEKEIHNLARLSKRRTVITLGIAYRTDIDVLARLPELVRDVIEGCTDATMVRCGLMKFGASSLDFEVQYDVHSEDYQVVFDMRHAVHIAILRRFDALGIEFAYPTQPPITAAPDDKAVPPGPAKPA